MSETRYVRLSTRQFCRVANIPVSVLREFVSVGIIEPQGPSPHRWDFDDQMLRMAQRAVRLQRELDIDWAGVAVALDLLRQLDQLREENRRLSQQLARFLQDS